MTKERARRRRALAALAASVSLGLAEGAPAEELDININDDAVRFTGSWDLTGKLDAEAGWLHHTDEGDVAHLGVHLVDLATGGEHPVRAGLGGRFVYFDADRRNGDGTGLPLGGYLRHNLTRADRVQLGAYAYFAPSVLSFGGADRYRELGGFVGYEVLRQGTLYLGLRNVNVDFDNRRSISIDSGLHLGMRLRF